MTTIKPTLTIQARLYRLEDLLRLTLTADEIASDLSPVHDPSRVIIHRYLRYCIDAAKDCRAAYNEKHGL